MLCCSRDYGRKGEKCGIFGNGRISPGAGGVDGKKGRNGVRMMVEVEMFDPRFFLDQE